MYRDPGKLSHQPFADPTEKAVLSALHTISWCLSQPTLKGGQGRQLGSTEVYGDKPNDVKW